MNEFPLYTVPQYITRKKNPSHDTYLYSRWNNPTARSTTKKTRTTNQHRLAHSTTKDDSSVTPTLKTLCTLNTRSSHQNENENADTLINLTIWNQPLVQYLMPNRPSNTTTRSRLPRSTAVHDKLINPPKLSCLLHLFTSISCVALSCLILLVDSFTMVKIDDQYPDEWFD